ncbi:hypothetical protein T265_05864 [Opisthorchis viverrini]|uniref:Uncharacterized protein n=1 Tax=Opisthorchis viverrini TaxID=6198 RepID=A0A075AET2_OPIVI|nr:hypothetical protein T265_05864 [Opisthorchis viverrini]KER27034.1 hypothetical protein T265_05864 [Opisthorchis viverrini]
MAFDVDKAQLLRSVSRVIVPVQNFAAAWGKPIAVWSAGAGVLALYFVDWKVIFARIPGYKRKFDEDTVR